MARLVLVAHLSVFGLLTLATPACCCAGGGNILTPPHAGPPGTITGQILRPPTAPSEALEVYAVNTPEYDQPYPYAATHVSATDSSYSLTLPPGGYLVLARFDGGRLAGGATYFTTCPSQPKCDPAQASHNYLLAQLVESRKVVTGVDIGDWGLPDVQGLLWPIDTYGSPLPERLGPSPSPRSLALRSMPSASSTESTMGWASSYFGVSLQIPATWLKVKRPLSKYRTLSDDAYFANETVSTPIALDSKGVWLTVRFHGLQACSLPDWRYATAKTTLTTQGGATDFFFEDPPPRDGPQPFAGYGVRGCTSLFDRNMEFMFTGVTKDSFEDNLGAFFQMMQSASFVQPGPRTVDAP